MWVRQDGINLSNSPSPSYPSPLAHPVGGASNIITVIVQRKWPTFSGITDNKWLPCSALPAIKWHHIDGEYASKVTAKCFYELVVYFTASLYTCWDLFFFLFFQQIVFDNVLCTSNSLNMGSFGDMLDSQINTTGRRTLSIRHKWTHHYHSMCTESVQKQFTESFQAIFRLLSLKATPVMSRLVSF